MSKTENSSIGQYTTPGGNGSGSVSNGSLMTSGSSANINVGSSSINSTLASASNVLKLSNLPSDLTKREASLIFSLVVDELLSVEIVEYQVFAYFKNVNTCLTAGKLLDGKFIFGSDYGPVKVEYENSPLNSPSSISQSATSAFNNLRLSNSKISPPTLNSQPNQSATNPNASSSQQSNPPGIGVAGAVGAFDNFQKRQSLGNQRSRFVFSDPFGGPQGTHRGTSGSGSSSGGINLGDITGKSLLLMESQNDAREYENLVRDPWGTNNNSLPISSAPQTPAVSGSSHAPFDWSNNSSNSADRRRTSSAFFNNSVQPLSAQSSSSTLLGNQQGSAQASNQSTSNGSSQLPSLGIQPHHNSIGLSTSSGNSQASSSNLPQSASGLGQSQPQSSIAQTLSNAQASNQSSASQPQSASNTTQSNANSSNQAPNTRSSQSASKDVPDLSLLARVPPPANPADQNPPCNTLYVGNLPPDATEAELRSLFFPQKGFRRLSFRTKNSSSANPNSGGGHNHGPMCFVEFEDVAHATRALAELYGRALPRPNGGSGKGGIRLSFSKNPLGVRGPGNTRRSSSNQVSSSSNGNGNGNGNSNGVNNYGYLGYQQK